MLKWEKQLRAMCAKLGAKFVYYKPDGGVWKFEASLCDAPPSTALCSLFL